jgi:LDH2 family malate/lactate/ureidoglycolate dehydrogenase
MFDEPARPSWHNASFTVWNVAAMTSEEAFQNRLRHLVDEIHAAKTAEGIDRVLLPGEREWEHRRRAMRGGIPLPPDVTAKLRSIAIETALHPAWLPRD